LRQKYFQAEEKMYSIEKSNLNNPQNETDLNIKKNFKDKRIFYLNYISFTYNMKQTLEYIKQTFELSTTIVRNIQNNHPTTKRTKKKRISYAG